jgi:hypothetical protein
MSAQQTSYNGGSDLSPLSVVIIIVVWYRNKYKRRNELLLKIPAVKSFPFIGSNLAFLGKSVVGIWQTMEQFPQQLGSVWRYDFTPFLTAIMVTDPEIVQKILSSSKLITKSVEYEFLRNWLGDGESVFLLFQEKLNAVFFPQDF